MKKVKIILSIVMFCLVCNIAFAQFPRVASNLGVNVNSVNYEGTVEGPGGGFDIEGYGASKRFSGGAFIEFDVELDVRSVIGGGDFLIFKDLKLQIPQVRILNREQSLT